MRPIAALLLCLLSLPVSVAQQPPPGAPVFPRVSSYALDKSKFTVPEDFAGQLNILILLFERQHEETAQAWNRSLASLLAAHPEVRSYELPIYGRVNILSRWYINGSMRSSSEDNTHWHDTIPLYVDKDDLRDTLHINSEKQIVLMIADKQGHIFWQAAGAPSQENQAALAGALSAALARR